MKKLRQIGKKEMMWKGYFPIANKIQGFSDYSERYVVNALLLRWHFRLSVRLSVTRVYCE